MRITGIESRDVGDEVETSALVGDVRLWYRTPRGLATTGTADPFVAAAFFPAAVHGEPIEVDETRGVSPQLCAGMERLQEIFGCWNRTLKRFPVSAGRVVSEPLNEGTASFFSGGVDGQYTERTRHTELTHLIYIGGFDFDMPPDLLEASLQRVARQAERTGKELVPVETNFFSYNERHGIDRRLSHGSCLASVALLLGFPRCYIPSSNTYSHLHPWGTHPLTDAHWSTEYTTIVHDDMAATRTGKIAAIARTPELLEELTVCWNRPERNCGVCAKCMRTRVTLQLLGVESDAFPGGVRPREVARLGAESKIDLLYFFDNMRLAEEVGDEAMRRALQRAVRRNVLKLLIKEYDATVLGGRLIRWYQERIQRIPLSGEQPVGPEG